MRFLERLQQLKTHLMLVNPFYGYLIIGLEFIEKNDMPVPTIGTDGDRIYYTEQYMQSLSDKEFIFVCVHELIHVAFAHIERIGQRSILLWNIATDIVTNEMLATGKIGKQPDSTLKGSMLFSSQSHYKGKSAEEIYKLLLKNAGEITVATSNNFDHHLPADRSSRKGKSAEYIRNKWQRKVSEATMFAKDQGKLPGEIGLELDFMKKGVVQWYRLLARHIQQRFPYDTSFQSLNRRFITRGLKFPGPLKEGLDIVVAIDTSGSISDKEAAVFVGETFNILKQFQRINIHFMQCDAQIQEVKIFNNHDMPPGKFKIKGRGGTDFRPVFRHVEQAGLIIDAVIYMTDMYGSFPDRAPDYPVYWIMTTKDKKPPFGTGIHFPPLEKY